VRAFHTADVCLVVTSSRFVWFLRRSCPASIMHSTRVATLSGWLSLQHPGVLTKSHKTACWRHWVQSLRSTSRKEGDHARRDIVGSVVSLTSCVPLVHHRLACSGTSGAPPSYPSTPLAEYRTTAGTHPPHPCATTRRSLAHRARMTEAASSMERFLALFLSQTSVFSRMRITYRDQDAWLTALISPAYRTLSRKAR
jgi:hypothetical protein